MTAIILKYITLSEKWVAVKSPTICFADNVFFVFIGVVLYLPEKHEYNNNLGMVILH